MNRIRDARRTGGRRRAGLVALAALFVGGCAGAGEDASGTDAAEGDAGQPAAATVAVGPEVPDSFVVALETSAGSIEILVRTAWAPLGAARVYELAEMGFWSGSRIYRVNERYAQWGYSGRPEVDLTWVARTIPDEPVAASNVRGAVSFARGGPDTRSMILFINRGDNTNLDDIEWNGVLGFPPIGEVRAGMDVVDRLHDGYGETPMQWEDSIASVGNSFLDRRFPELDSITDVRIVEDWK